MCNSPGAPHQPENLRVAYLCLQATREGQASHAHVHEIIRGLRRRNWRVELFEPFYAGREKRPGLIAKLVAFVGTQARLCLCLRRFDLLYVRSHPLSIPTMTLARLLRVPTIYEINGGYEDLFLGFPWTRRLSWVFKRVMRIPLRLATQRIAVTQELMDWANREAGEKVSYMIPNGANDELFRPDATTDRELPRPYAIFFGAFAPWQGLGDLLLAAQHPEWPEAVHLVLIGDGAERRTVEETTRQNPRITYLGRVPYRQMPGLVAQSMLGLCPMNNLHGRSETGLAPLKMFETMASGVPVIVTDFPGQADVVRDESCGLVVPAADPKAIAHAVRELAEDPALRHEMGRRGRDAIVAKHSWDCRAQATSEALLALKAGSAKRCPSEAGSEAGDK